jgi:hypothetical protein
LIGYWRLAMTDDGLLRHDRHVAEGRLEGRREKFSAAYLPLPGLATIGPFSLATMSPLRKVGSFSMSTSASPVAPLQPQPATISVR